jgi:hypothetical protein
MKASGSPDLEFFIVAQQYLGEDGERSLRSRFRNNRQ